MLKVEIGKENTRQIEELSAIKAVAKYLHHLRTLNIIRHTMPVIIASQQHRGAFLAYMQGDNAYEEKVVKLQNEIDYRLTTLKLLNHELGEPVSEQKISQLILEWQNVKIWSGGPSIENFNLHSHFIEQQMKLVWSATEKTKLFFNEHETLSEVNDTFRKIDKKNDGILVRFCLHETPELIELIAKIRGLATHASVAGKCDAEHASWLGYLLRQLNQKKEQFRLVSKSLQKYALHDLPALVDMQMQDSRIVQLVQIVDEEILRSNNIQIDHQALFIMATNIIKSQTEVVYQGLDYIQNKMHRLFDDELKGEIY
jgi:hypothetical protein